MSDATGKPSQAEGADPDRPDSEGTTGSQATGKPSQAEGDDPAPQSEGESAGGSTPSGA